MTSARRPCTATCTARPSATSGSGKDGEGGGGEGRGGKGGKGKGGEGKGRGGKGREGREGKGKEGEREGREARRDRRPASAPYRGACAVGPVVLGGGDLVDGLVGWSVDGLLAGLITVLVG